MSKSVDNRVVQMEFDNAAFEKGVSQTIRSLETLNNTISGAETQSRFGDIFDRLGFNNGIVGKIQEITHGVSSLFGTIIDKFGLIGKLAGGITALGSGGLIGMALTGGKRRALNIEQAKFMLKGLGHAWEEFAGDIDYAVSGTRYGLDAAAKAAAQLVASGVKAGDGMKEALRGISGVASMTNSEYEDISDVFTRIAGQGRVMANDLNSLAARGLNAAGVLADAMHTTEAEIRDMVSKGEIDFATFAHYMDDKFGKAATSANETFTGAMANARAALNRIGAEFYITSKIAIDGQKDVAVGGLELGRRIFAALIPVLNSIKMTMGPIVDTWREWTYWAAKGAEMVLLRLEKLFWYQEDGVKKLTSFGRGMGDLFHVVADNVMSLVQPLINIKNSLKTLRPFSGEFKKDMHSIYEFIRPIRLKFTELIGVFHLGDGAIRLITAAFQAFLNVVAPVFNSFFDSATDGAAGFVDWLKVLHDAVDEKLGNVATVLETLLPKFSEFGEMLTNLPNAIGAFVGKHGNRLVNFFKSFKVAFDELLSEHGIEDFVSWIGEKLSNAMSTLLSYGQPVFDFLDGLRTKIGEFLSEFGGGFLGGLFDGITNFKFPGFDLFSGDEDQSALDKIGESVDKLGKDLAKNPLAKTFEKIGSAVSEFVSSLDEGPAHLSDWRNLFGRLKDAISDFANEVLPLEKAGEVLQGFFGSISGFGTDAFSGLGSLAGDNGHVAKFLDSVSKAASNMFAQFKKGLPTAEQLRGALDKVGGKLSEFLKLIAPVGQKLGEVFGLAVQHVADFIGKIGETLSGMDFSFEPIVGFLDSIADALLNFFQTMEDTPLLENVGQLFEDLGGALGGFVSEVLPKLGEVGKGLSELFDSFGGFDAIGGILSNVTGMLDAFNPSLERTADSVERVSNSIAKPTGMLSKSLGDLSGSIRETGDSIQTVEEVFGNADQGVGAKIQELADGVNTGVENILPAVVAAAFGWRVFTFSKTLSDFLDNVGGVAEKAKGVMDGMQKILDNYAKGMKNASSKLSLIRDIALALVGLALSLYLLTTVDTGKLWSSVGAIVVLGIAIGGIAAALSFMTTKLKGFDALAVQQVGLGMLMMAGAIAVLAVAIKLLEGSSIEELGPGLVALGAGLVALAAGSAIIGKAAPEVAKFGIGLFFMATSIIALATAAVFISKVVNLPGIAQGLLTVVAALFIFAGVGRLLGDGGRNMIQLAVGLAVLAGAFVLWLQVVQIFNQVDWGSLESGLWAVAGGLGAMLVAAVVLSLAQKGMIAGAFGIMAMAGAMIVLVMAVTLLAKAMETLPNMGEALTRLEELIVVFGGVLAIMMLFSATSGASALLAIGSIIAMSAAIVVLTGALVVLSAIDPNRLITVAVCLATLMGAIVAIGALASVGAIGAGIIVLAGAILVISVATVVAAVGVTGFAVALALLGTIAPGVANGVSEAMQTIGDAMRANGLEVTWATALMVVGILAIAAAINLAAGGMVAFALGLLAVVAVVAVAVYAISQLASGIDSADFGSIGGKMVTGIVDGVKGALSTAAGFFAGIGDAIAGFITGGIDGNVEQVEASTQALADAATTPTEEIPVETNANLKSAHDAFASFLGDGGSIPELVSGGMGGMLDNLGVGMDSFREMLESGAVDGTKLFGDGFDITSISNEQLQELVSNTDVDMSMIPEITGGAGADASAAYSEQFKTAEVSAEEMQAAADAMASVDFMGPAQTKGKEGTEGLRRGFTGTRAIGLKGANELVSGVRSVDVSGPGRGAGSGIVSGMIAGLNALAPTVYARAEEIARTAALKAKSGAQVNSPSKLTIPVGEAIGEGLIVGMNKIASTVNRTGEQLGRNSALAVRVASQMMDGIDWDAAPVIRPVLDTSGIQNGLQTMNRMLAQETMLTSAGYATTPSLAAAPMQNITSSNDNYYFHLDYKAGDDPNTLLLAIGNAIRQGNLTRG